MKKNEIIVEMSARHVHLSQQALEILFGKGAELISKHELSQPGQYLSEQRVTLVGPKKTIENVAILGPVRPETQIEISVTDAWALGIKAPVRMSGQIKDSGGAKLIGPAGEVEINEGVIVAKRHIHMVPEDALQLGITDGQIVSVKLGGERSIIFGETIVRVSKDFATRMHIDTDEANALCLQKEQTGEIIID